MFSVNIATLAKQSKAGTPKVNSRTLGNYITNIATRFAKIIRESLKTSNLSRGKRVSREMSMQIGAWIRCALSDS